MKNIEFIDYTEGEFEKLENSKELKDIIIEFLDTLKQKDTDGLIYNNNKYELNVEINQVGESGCIYFNIRINTTLNRSRNEIKLYISIDKDILYIYEFIKVSSYPRRGKYMLCMLDNIEFRWGYSDRTNLIIKRKEDIKDVVDNIIVKGYSLWGSNWGYITKRGRHMRGTLATRFGWKVRYIKEKDYSGGYFVCRTRAWKKKHLNNK